MRKATGPYKLVPEYVRILAVDYEVVIWDEMTASQSDNLGLCDLDNSRIYLSPSMAESKLREVFLHECVHAIWDGLGMSGRAVDEEFAVGQVAIGLIVFCRDNPDLSEFFFGRRVGHAGDVV